MANYTIDIRGSGHSFQAEGFRVGDNGIRTLIFHLTDGENTFSLSDDSIATLFARLPSGATLFESCCIEGDTVTYTPAGGTDAPSLTSEAGCVLCEIRITSKEGKVVTSPRFSLFVDSILQDDDAIEAQSSFSALTDALGRVLTAEDGLASKTDKVYGTKGNAVIFGEGGALSDFGAPPCKVYIMNYNEDGSFDLENLSAIENIKADISASRPFSVYIRDIDTDLPAAVVSYSNGIRVSAIYPDGAGMLIIRQTGSAIRYEYEDNYSSSFSESSTQPASQKATAVWVKALIDETITEGAW